MQTLARFVLFNPYLLLLEAFYVYLSNLKNPSAVVFSKPIRQSKIGRLWDKFPETSQ